MDQELKQYLDGKFAEANGKMEAKFSEIYAKFSEIYAKFSEMEKKFATKEDLERVETTLLTEFHKWASPTDARARTHTAAIRAVDLELEALTERVQKLEKPN
jgi:hypothetical protein